MYLKYTCFDYRVMVKDPFHASCLPVHIGTLVELGKANGKIYTRVYSYSMFSLVPLNISLMFLFCFCLCRVVLPLTQTCRLVSQQPSKFSFHYLICYTFFPPIILLITKSLLTRCLGLLWVATISWLAIKTNMLDDTSGIYVAS